MAATHSRVAHELPRCSGLRHVRDDGRADGGAGSQGRVAAYVVSGIGFLGGGVILKDASSIRGLNTGATLWCTAAIGTLAGLGYTSLCFLGTVAVLAANLLLRQLVGSIRLPFEFLKRLFCTFSNAYAGLQMKFRFAHFCSRHRVHAAVSLRTGYRRRGRNESSQGESACKFDWKKG
jgi:hypothetical protein